MKTSPQPEIIIPSWLPVVSGFYETSWDPDPEIQQYWESLGKSWENDSSWLKYWANCCYTADCMKLACAQLHKWLPKESGIVAMTMEKVVSPKEYNFENDAVHVDYLVNMAKFGRWFRKLIRNHAAEWEEYLTRYDSRPGFASYYSSDPEVWAWLTDNYTSFAVKPTAEFWQREYFPKHGLGSCLQFWFELNTERLGGGEDRLDNRLCDIVKERIDVANYLLIPEAA